MRKKRPIKIGGVEYPVIERMGFQHSAGAYTAAVRMPDGSEKIARAPYARGPWRFHNASDRLAPLSAAIAAGWTVENGWPK